ncbi:hypothetical protein BLNAU_19704 [Blattamonas nauphoetae]|uniref:Uncharacterized protein n=1 Tax=Blattamonas nauphoetae TaxID=2049346 RepID=A0ABQ9X0S2_9EUKA|nr:hypothetical protein BLNAU_19704 [Blattamonas nauphoetae]
MNTKKSRRKQDQASESRPLFQQHANVSSHQTPVNRPLHSRERSRENLFDTTDSIRSKKASSDSSSKHLSQHPGRATPQRLAPLNRSLPEDNDVPTENSTRSNTDSETTSFDYLNQQSANQDSAFDVDYVNPDDFELHRKKALELCDSLLASDQAKQLEGVNQWLDQFQQEYSLESPRSELYEERWKLVNGSIEESREETQNVLKALEKERKTAWEEWQKIAKQLSEAEKELVWRANRSNIMSEEEESQIRELSALNSKVTLLRTALTNARVTLRNCETEQRKVRDKLTNQRHLMTYGVLQDSIPEEQTKEEESNMQKYATLNPEEIAKEMEMTRGRKKQEEEKKKELERELKAMKDSVNQRKDVVKKMEEEEWKKDDAIYEVKKKIQNMKKRAEQERLKQLQAEQALDRDDPLNPLPLTSATHSFNPPTTPSGSSVGRPTSRPGSVGTQMNSGMFGDMPQFQTLGVQTMYDWFSIRRDLVKEMERRQKEEEEFERNGGISDKTPFLMALKMGMDAETNKLASPKSVKKKESEEQEKGKKKKGKKGKKSEENKDEEKSPDQPEPEKDVDVEQLLIGKLVQQSKSNTSSKKRRVILKEEERTTVLARFVAEADELKQQERALQRELLIEEAKKKEADDKQREEEKKKNEDEGVFFGETEDVRAQREKMWQDASSQRIEAGLDKIRYKMPKPYADLTEENQCSQLERDNILLCRCIAFVLTEKDKVDRVRHLKERKRKDKGS